MNDDLIIYYSQCHATNKIGGGRSIVAKDAGGSIVKEWKFKDAAGSENAMIIPVKELIALKKGQEELSLVLFYKAQTPGREQELGSLYLMK